MLRARFRITHVERAGVDLPKVLERNHSRRRRAGSGLRIRKTAQAQFHQAEARDRGAEQTTAPGVDLFRHGSFSFV